MYALILAAPPSADSYLEPALIIGLGLLGVAIAVALLISKLMVVGNPSEMLVISGRRSAQGQGYRTLIGGRTLVIPIIEKVSRISLRNMQVGLEVSARSGGGKMIPVTVTGVANVKSVFEARPARQRD